MMNRNMLVAGQKGKHLLYEADSRSVQFKPTFDLVVTSPPFFHPTKRRSGHGFIPNTKTLESYAEYVSDILAAAACGLNDG